MAAEDRLEAGEVHRALVVQLQPESADCGHHIVGFRQEPWGVGDAHIPDARRAWGLQFDGPSHGLPPLDDVLGVAAPEVSDGALAVGVRSAGRWQMSSSRATACLSSSSCSWPCVAGPNPGDAPLSASVNRSAASEWTPCRAAFAWKAASAHAAGASSRRIAPWGRFPLSGRPLPSGSTRPGTSVGAPPRAPGHHALCGGVRTPCPRPPRA